MANFPLPLADLLGHWGSYAVYAVIGIAFGMTLESAGFGNSKLLAAQFYFKDMRVFKVMFTAIIVAMTLIFLSSAMGILDYNLIWVPPTYLWPGIVGGLIMGVGFIIGGFCPGTSLVGLATGKLDAFMFVFGVLFGIYMFGETVGSFATFFDSSNMGRFTLPELFNASYGVVVISIVVVALMLFVVSEKVEAMVNNRPQQKLPGWSKPAAAALVALAAVVFVIGQPSSEDRWRKVEAESQAKLDGRAVQISSAEFLKYRDDSKIKIIPLDVREERYYNQFHLRGAVHVPLEEIQAKARELQFEPANTIFVTISNDEAASTEAWKILMAESVPNIYILEGGVNAWLKNYAGDSLGQDDRVYNRQEDQLAYKFNAATGSRHPAAEPSPDHLDLTYEPKVIMELKRAPTSGGCG
ncbi:MAG: YeeE/YedE thiosulfate transporter family protein [Xanthomonadales bacterium]|nr:YeeE/YedE thiosulfate transporter family protein [Xanthomonadales bacterium]